MRASSSNPKKTTIGQFSARKPKRTGKQPFLKMQGAAVAGVVADAVAAVKSASPVATICPRIR
jgi:hypothetical protein